MIPREEPAAVERTPTETAPVEAQSVEPCHVRRMSLQRYLLPLLAAILLVGGWLCIYWMLHEDQDPRSLVRRMQDPGRRSWQNAYALSQWLHDGAHDALKEDRPLCHDLTTILARQNELAAADPATRADDQHVRFRVFLCRALGEFRLVDPLPILLATLQSPASHGNDAVRQAALEAIAVLTDHVGADRVRNHWPTLDVVLDTSRLRGTSDSDVELAATAAYTLGVLGGPRALAQLAVLVDDPREDIRYNAATGLARHADVRSLPVLLEMLEPDEHERGADDKSNAARRQRECLVISNGIRGVERLYGRASLPPQGELNAALVRLVGCAELPAPIRMQAKAMRLTWESAR